MKINEVEQTTGIAKKNIRFYEQEGLLRPSRGANGYRDYTQEDVELLLRIKLMRKLDIPLEEIKRLLSGSLTLEDCLRRHLIVLERRSRNLEAMEKFCGRILMEGPVLTALPVEQLLLEMENAEKGGTKFMDVRKKEHKKKKQDSIISAVIAICFSALFLGIMILGIIAVSGGDENFGAPAILVLLAAVSILSIAGTLLALKERLREIEGGELDEASKY